MGYTNVGTSAARRMGIRLQCEQRHDSSIQFMYDIRCDVPGSGLASFALNMDDDFYWRGCSPLLAVAT